MKYTTILLIAALFVLPARAVAEKHVDSHGSVGGTFAYGDHAFHALFVLGWELLVRGDDQPDVFIHADAGITDRDADFPVGFAGHVLASIGSIFQVAYLGEVHDHEGEYAPGNSLMVGTGFSGVRLLIGPTAMTEPDGELKLGGTIMGLYHEPHSETNAAPFGTHLHVSLMPEHGDDGEEGWAVVGHLTVHWDIFGHDHPTTKRDPYSRTRSDPHYGHNHPPGHRH